MNPTETINLQPGDERAYAVMAQVAQSSVAELLIPFKAAADADTLLDTMSMEEFFQKFLVYADKFSDLCCQNYAKVMRQCALIGEVKGTPTIALAKEIRQQVFEPLDGLLVSYIQILNKLGLDLSQVSAELSGTSITDAALRGAAVGQVAGGFGSSGKTLGGLNALIQAGVEAEKKLALLQQRAELLRQAESITFPKIVEYLKAVADLPERLVDYGCARCFGGEVSLQRQQAALEGVQEAIERELAPALSLTLGLPEAQKRVEQRRLEESIKQQNLKELKPSPEKGCLGIIASVIFAGLALSGCDLNSEGAIAGSLILWVCAIVALFFGIVMFKDRRAVKVPQAEPLEAKPPLQTSDKVGHPMGGNDGDGH
jgi:hypothetical protein